MRKVAKVAIKAQEAAPDLCLGVSRLVAETLVFYGYMLYNMTVQVGARRHDH